MSNLKFVTGHTAAVKNLYADVGTQNFVCYDIEKFHISSLSGFYPKTYLDKCFSVTVAISGGANQRDWMAVIPFRVDAQKNGQKVYDQDPFIISFDADSGIPAETGIVAYHQNFDGRTCHVSGYDTFSKPETVSALRQDIVTGMYPLSSAGPQVLNALHHMAGLFTKYLL